MYEGGGGIKNYPNSLQSPDTNLTLNLIEDKKRGW